MSLGTNHPFSIDHWYDLRFHDARHREEASYRYCGERVELDFLALGVPADRPPMASSRRLKACVTLRLDRDRTPSDAASRALLDSLAVTTPVPPDFDWATHLAPQRLRGRFGPPARAGGRNPLELLRSDPIDGDADRAADPTSVPRTAADGTSRHVAGVKRAAPVDADVRPRWDGDTRRLYRGQERILVYKRSAVNQAKILACFEEMGWPEQIDDPLKPERLRNTLRDLQQVCKRQNAPISFAGGGDGTSIRWAWR